jgi:hypothetical protein
MTFEGTVSTRVARGILRRELGRRISRQTLVRLIEVGDLTAFKMGSEYAHWAIRHDSLMAYIRRLRETPPN